MYDMTSDANSTAPHSSCLQAVFVGVGVSQTLQPSSEPFSVFIDARKSSEVCMNKMEHTKPNSETQTHEIAFFACSLRSEITQHLVVIELCLYFFRIRITFFFGKSALRVV